MQKWPYADFGYISREHFRKPQKREYLTVQAVFVSENTVMFFDHYTKEYRGQRSELDAYLEKLGTDGWKLTYAGSMVNGKGYQFRRYHFRRLME